MVATSIVRRVFKYWETIKLLEAKIQFSKMLLFTSKLEFYHWQQVLSIVFPEATGSLHFQENACQTPNSIT